MALEPHWEAMLRQVFLDLPDAVGAEVKDAGGQRGIGATVCQRSQQMLANGSFSHYDGAGNLIFAGLLNGVGFPYAFAGENLAENNYPWGQSLDQANAALMNSPTHRANILNTRFNQVGVGIAGPDGNGRFYYTQLFAQAW